MRGTIKVLIVDDEPLARENLRRHLTKLEDVSLVGEADDVETAATLIRARRPDLLLLDVRIRGGNGFEVLDLVPEEMRPQVVFVSAHDEHAVRAFSVRAIDYLLKPIDAQRLRSAIDRAHEALQAQKASERHRRDDRERPEVDQAASLARFVVRSVGKILLIDVSDVDWIEAAGNYVRLHHGGESHLLRQTMASLGSRLEPRQFVRIHRSTIVNLHRVRELRHVLHGDYAVELRDGTRLTLSRGFREQFGKVLESTTNLRIPG